MDNRYPVARRDDPLNSYLAGENPRNRITARMWIIHYLAEHPGLDDTRIAFLHDEDWKAALRANRPFARVSHTRLRTERDRLHTEGAVEFAGQGKSLSGRTAATWRLPGRDSDGGQDRLGGASSPGA